MRNKIPTFEQLMVFSAIAQRKSLSGAAKMLNIPASTVGRRLSELEALVGVTLVHRTTRACRLSGDGEYYLVRFKHLLNQLEQTFGELNDKEQLSPAGSLRVTCPVSFGYYKLQPIMNDFVTQYPDIDVQLFLKNEYVDLVGEGYDVAIRFGPLKDSSLIAQKIGAVYYSCVAASQLCESIAPVHNLEALHDHPCIALAPQPGKEKWVLKSPAGDQSFEFRPRFIVNDPIYAFDMVKNNLGVACLPDFIIRDSLNDGSLKEIMPGWRSRPREAYVVYHSRTLMPTALRLFLDTLKLHLDDSLETKNG